MDGDFTRPEKPTDERMNPADGNMTPPDGMQLPDGEIPQPPTDGEMPNPPEVPSGADNNTAA